MAWEKLSGDTAAVAVKPDGKIIWNEAANEMLGNPVCVELHHDAAGNRLGFRRSRSDWGGSLTVYYQQDNNRFAVDSAAHLANAGISVEEIYVAIPQPPAPPGAPPDLGDEGIVWIAL